MLLHRLNQLLSSTDPRIVRIRTSIWENDALRESARFCVRMVRKVLNLPQAIKRLKASNETAKLKTFAAARLQGGSLSLEDIEALWGLQRYGGETLIDADPLERAHHRLPLGVARTSPDRARPGVIRLHRSKAIVIAPCSRAANGAIFARER